jgi:hypothetical protein
MVPEPSNDVRGPAMLGISQAALTGPPFFWNGEHRSSKFFGSCGKPIHAPRPCMGDQCRWRAYLFPQMASHLMSIRSDFLHSVLQLIARHAQYFAPPLDFGFIAKIYPVAVFGLKFGLFHRTSIHQAVC